MRITYQDGKLYYSITKDEFAKQEEGKPTEIDVMWLPHLLKDISDANYEHWRKEIVKQELKKNTKK
jgi:hypothetical protein|tara:strand:+ start:234 stop:431 length:198 start_codon:yes stop_codon:yes gene_type:complete